MRKKWCVWGRINMAYVIILSIESKWSCRQSHLQMLLHQVMDRPVCPQLQLLLLQPQQQRFKQWMLSSKLQDWWEQSLVFLIGVFLIVFLGWIFFRFFFFYLVLIRPKYLIKNVQVFLKQRCTCLSKVNSFPNKTAKHQWSKAAVEEI